MSLLDPSFSDNAAIVLEDGTIVSHGELARTIELHRPAFEPGSLVFLLCDNDFPSLIAYLSAMAAGAVPLLLNANIAHAPLAALLKAYEPRFLVRQAAAAGDTPGRITHRIEGLGLFEIPSAPAHVLNKELALLLATSGSTGSPRLVRLTSGNLRANAMSIADYLAIDSRERAITTLPMSYSYGLSVINSHLLAGASIVLTNRSLVDAGFWQLVRKHAVTSLAGVPYSYEMLLRLKLERLEMPSVKTLTQAGGRLAPDKVALIASACKAKGIRFVPMYGQTEATARIAYLPGEWIDRKPGSIGVAIPGGSLWLEDESGARIAHAGQSGELVYSGPNVSLGYAECAGDLASGDDNHGVLHTGDIATQDEDGLFTIVGRLNRFIKVHGMRISLDAVESLLAKEGLSAAVTGEDDRLSVTLAGSAPPDASPADIDCLSSLLGVHRSAIAVRRVDQLPRLESGKVDYQRLRSAA